MSTKPILPWHLTVGTFAADRTRAAVAGFEPSNTSAQAFAALVAEHDPHAAQQETVRLLEQAATCFDEIATHTPSDYVAVIAKGRATQIRAHLAKLRKGGAT